MIRRLLNLLVNATAVLSFLLFVSVVVLWARSYSKAEHFWLIYREGGSELLRTDGGDFTFYRWTSSERDSRAAGPVRFEYAAGSLVGSHATPGSFPVTRRWGPFSYAAVPPPPPPSREEIEDARRVLREMEQSRNQTLPSDPRVRLRRLMDAQRATSIVSGRYNSHWRFVFPAWFALVPLLIISLFTTSRLLRHRREARRTRRGACRHCGYDLTGNVSGICPECGRTR